MEAGARPRPATLALDLQPSNSPRVGPCAALPFPNDLLSFSNNSRYSLISKGWFSSCLNSCLVLSPPLPQGTGQLCAAARRVPGAVLLPGQLCQGWVARAGGCPCPWLCGAILSPCMAVGADVKLFGLPGPLPASWVGLSLLGAVLGISPHPDLSLEGQLCSVGGAGTPHPSWSIHGEPSPAALSPVSPVNRVWCEAAPQGPGGAPRAPQCTWVTSVEQSGQIRAPMRSRSERSSSLRCRVYLNWNLGCLPQCT